MKFWNSNREDAAEEMRLHIEEKAAELEAEGLEPAEALRQARLAFGSVTRMNERVRAEWQWAWWEDLRADLRYGIRSLRRSPGFFVAAVLSLALGVGVNSTLFSLTNEFLFSTPSAVHGSKIWRARLGGSSHVDPATLRFLAEHGFFPGVAGNREDGEINWRDGGETRSLHTMRVTANLFPMAGIPVAAGRGIQPGDEHVAVISYAMWQGKLGGDPMAVGRVLDLDGKAHVVVGVLPPDHRTLFGFGLATDLYLPSRPQTDELILYLLAPDGADHRLMRERLLIAAQRLDSAFPGREFKFSDEVSVEALGGVDRLRGRTMMSVAAFFGMLMTVGGLLLLIACINVSNLVLARGASRAREFAVRASLGAGRGRLVRQLLTESLLLTASGTGMGLILNLFLTRIFNRLPFELPVMLQLHIQPDWRLLGYASLLAFGSALTVGLLPALRIAKGELNDSMKRPMAKMGLRRGLVIAQVAVSILVLSAAVLFARNLLASFLVEPGFDLDQTLYVRARLVPERYATVEAKAAAVDRVSAQIRGTPGVFQAALTKMIPLNDDTNIGGAVTDAESGERRHMRYHFNRVSAGYFATAGIALRSGREFVEREADDAIIVNESFARQMFGTVAAAGRALRRENGAVWTVVGVVRDSKYAYLHEHERPAMFAPYRVILGSGRETAVQWMVRTAGPPGALVNPLRQAVSTVDASAAVEVRPMRQAMGMALLPSQIGGGLLGAMGVLGLALTGIGVYGVLAYSVSKRIREIGVRVALGARTGSVLALVLREAAFLTGTGLAIGLLVSYFLMKPLAGFLIPDISPADPVTYMAVAGLLGAVGLIASAVPARRAVRVDPTTALRYE